MPIHMLIEVPLLPPLPPHFQTVISCKFTQFYLKHLNILLSAVELLNLLNECNIIIYIVC